MERRSGDCDTEAIRAANRENVVVVVLGRCAQDMRAALDSLAAANLLTLVLDHHRLLASLSSTASSTASSAGATPVLRLTWADDDVTPILVWRLRRSLGVRSAALIRGSGAVTAGAAESFRLSVVREGLRLTPDLRLDADPPVVAAAVRESGAPAVHLATTAVEALDVIIALDAAGWVGVVLLSSLASDAKVFADRLDGLADGALFTRVEVEPGTHRTASKRGSDAIRRASPWRWARRTKCPTSTTALLALGGRRAAHGGVRCGWCAPSRPLQYLRGVAGRAGRWRSGSVALLQHGPASGRPGH